MRPDGQNLLLIQRLPGAETPGSRGSYRAAKDPKVSAPGPILESRVAFGRPVCSLILLAKTVWPDGRNLLVIQGFPEAETPGSYDAYRAAQDAGVSAPAEALLIGFMGNQGKVSFSEIWYG
jgi:hypothetical protein